MEFKDWFSLVWVVAGIVFAIAVCFWNLTFERKKRDDEKEFAKISSEIKEIKESATKEKEANEKFRRKHETSVSNMCLLMEEKFKSLNTQIQDLKYFFESKINVAIDANNKKNHDNY